MPAYKKANLVEFVHTSASEIIGQLQYGYANDGFLSQYTRQTKAWARVIPDLQQSFAVLLESRPEASDWSILLEYPLYRLRRRIDIVILVGDVIVLVECKVGAETFSTEDARQVEEYALDLRDFMPKVINAPSFRFSGALMLMMTLQSIYFRLPSSAT